MDNTSCSRPMSGVGWTGRSTMEDVLYPAAADPGEENTRCVCPDASALQASSSAMAKACILAKRCCGSLARAFITTSSIVGENLGTCVRRDGGEADRC